MKNCLYINLFITFLLQRWKEDLLLDEGALEAGGFLSLESDDIIFGRLLQENPVFNRDH